MSTMKFQDGGTTARVHGRERLHFHGLCVDTAAKVGVHGGLFEKPAPMLNACIKSGDDAIVLVARIHGQSEMNVYVEGPNRAWLADIIESGRTRGLLHEETGWSAVVILLRAENDKPVVISTTQGEEFPNINLAFFQETWTPSTEEELDDEWDDEWEKLPEGERWNLSVKALRAREQATDFGWELKPDNWITYRFATD